MILYLDTSALVKLYVWEPGTKEVRRLTHRATGWSTSLLAYVEARSAFARKLRMRQIDLRAFNRALKAFEFEWTGIDCIRIDQVIVERAAELAEKHALRAYDALHLASAVYLRGSVRSAVSFVCFDDALNRAAAGLGLQLPFTA